jgi:hypothetical protein
MKNNVRDIKCVYYNNDTERNEIDYTNDAEYLMSNVHKRDNSHHTQPNMLWVDKINDKLYHIIYCTPEYYKYKLAQEKNK